MTPETLMNSDPFALAINEMLGVDEKEEAAIYMLTVGKTPKKS